MEPVQVPEALAAGTAQYPEGFRRRGGRIRDSEGALAFYQNHFDFYADSGATMRYQYREIQSYSLKPGFIVRRLTNLKLHRIDGSTVRFRVGSEMAANAGFILAAKGITRA